MSEDLTPLLGLTVCGYEINRAPNGAFFFYRPESDSSVWQLPDDVAASVRACLAAVAALPTSARWEECAGPHGTAYFFDVQRDESTWLVPPELRRALPLRSDYAAAASPTRRALLAALIADTTRATTGLSTTSATSGSSTTSAASGSSTTAATSASSSTTAATSATAASASALAAPAAVTRNPLRRKPSQPAARRVSPPAAAAARVQLPARRSAARAKALPQPPVAAGAALQRHASSPTVVGAARDAARDAPRSAPLDAPPAQSEQANYFSLRGVEASPIEYGTLPEPRQSQRAMPPVPPPALATSEQPAPSLAFRNGVAPKPQMRTASGKLARRVAPNASGPPPRRAKPKKPALRQQPARSPPSRKRTGAVPGYTRRATVQTPPAHGGAPTTTNTASEDKYASMTMKQLIEELRSRGLGEAADNAEDKAELIGALRAADERALAAAAPQQAAPSPDYHAMKMPQLLRLALERGIDEAEDAETKMDVALLLEADDEARAALNAERAASGRRPMRVPHVDVSVQRDASPTGEPDDAPGDSGVFDSELEQAKMATLRRVQQTAQERASSMPQRLSAQRASRSRITFTVQDADIIEQAMTEEERRRSSESGGATGLVWTELDSELDSDDSEVGRASTSTGAPAMDLRERIEALDALLASEERYVAALARLDKQHLAALMLAARNDRKLRSLLSKIDPRRSLLQLHSAVQLLRERHGAFLAQLREQCEARDGSARIGALCREANEMLLLYGVYVSHECDVLATAKQSREQSDFAAVAALLDGDSAPAADDPEARPAFDALVRTPIVHIRSFVKLVRDTLLATPRAHADYSDLHDAVDAVQAELDDVEETRRLANERALERRATSPLTSPRGGGGGGSGAKKRTAAMSPVSVALAETGGVRINVTASAREAAGEVLAIDTLAEPVLRRHACEHASGASGEVLLTSQRAAFVGFGGLAGSSVGDVFSTLLADASPPRLSSGGAIEIVGDSRQATLRLHSFKSDEERDDFYAQLVYVYDCVHTRTPVLHYFELEVKFLDAGGGSKRKRQLLSCTLRVGGATLQLRFEHGRVREHELRHVRKWGHKGIRLSIVLGDGAEHLRIATRTEHDAEQVVAMLDHTARSLLPK